ncbi:hypothetical protein MRB53_028802 [Persea americana]|uniref:Uncharacterized protein n=1 Tax=Persea americana TaxID=3435 RepID=A0ACC2KGR3_PERAE|nr:hypothetical protein MRB53_028802 [Persea americana]
MTLKTAKGIWDFLKEEYEGNERVKGMQVLNMIREFEMQRMKESETIKDYSDRLLDIDIVNKVRLLGADFSDSRIVQKILVTVPEKFEATISSIENSKDVSSITLAELLNALQAQEQRKLMRQERSVEGAFQAISQNNMYKKEKQSYSNNSSNRQVERICKSQQQQGEAKTTVEQPQEEQLFVASCFATSSSTESWLIDSGCTSHMTYDQELFKELDKTAISKVKRDKLDKKAEPGVFVGYSSVSKAYRIYLPQNNKVIASRDVQFLESNRWSWENDKKLEFQEENDDIDDEPVKGTRSLSDIYQRCNVAIIEHAGYEEATANKKWMAAMKEEHKMIEKN